MNAVALLTLPLALAHTGAPAALTVSEVSPKRWTVDWAHPIDQPGPGTVRSDCRATPWSPPQLAADRIHHRLTLDCPTSAAPALHLSSDTPTTAVVRILPLQGQPSHTLVDLDPLPFTVHPSPETSATLLRYLGAGSLHVLRGLDHLLLLFGLGFAASRQDQPHRATLKTVTAFGVGHAVTVAILGLGLARLPGSWCEAAIAVTLVGFGLRTYQEAAPPTWRWAGVCGLIHGLGFGGALADMGLPLGQSMLALLGFNAGVDLVQVAVSIAAVALLGLPLLARHRPRLSTGLAIVTSTVGFAWLWGTFGA